MTAESKSTKSGINPHNAFYRQFMRPYLKVCVISVGTYYSMMGLWEYLYRRENERKAVAV